MSATADRASRRELRRAMGASAITVINSHADSLADILRGLEQFNARLTAEVTDRASHLDALTARLTTVEDLTTRTLWGRLRWLLRGQ